MCMLFISLYNIIKVMPLLPKPAYSSDFHMPNSCLFSCRKLLPLLLDVINLRASCCDKLSFMAASLRSPVCQKAYCFSPNCSHCRYARQARRGLKTELGRLSRHPSHRLRASKIHLQVCRECELRSLLARAISGCEQICSRRPFGICAAFVNHPNRHNCLGGFKIRL